MTNFNITRLGWAAAISIILLWSCGEEDTVSENNNYEFQLPENFPNAVYAFEDNAVTKEGFELGRQLFYDPILSIDNSIACSNCHRRRDSFADQARFSRGVDRRLGVRNALPIQNMAFQTEFFWDGSVANLDAVPINAITSEIEMGETLEHVVQKLQTSEDYRQKFKQAFGTDAITSAQLLQALSQFMNLMISANSRYDKYVRNEGEQLSKSELEGLALFETKCSSCHSTDLFTDQSFRNNGLDATFDADAGRANITKDENDRGKFKVPSLRNVEFTSPYMHDGRFRTLEQVLDHYVNSVKLSETLDPLLNANGNLGLEITEDEKGKIIEFLKTLSDSEFMQDTRFARP